MISVHQNTSDEEFHAFDDGNARPDTTQKQEVHQMKTRNAKLYRTAWAEISPAQELNAPRRDATETEIFPGHSNSLHQASCSANHANSHCHSFLPNQVNSRVRLPNQSSHHSSNRTKCRGVLHRQANS